MLYVLLIALLNPPAAAPANPGDPPAVNPTPDAEAPLDIRADRLEIDQRAGLARFSGQVTARQGALELRCAALVARYRADGEIDRLDAEGGVEVQAEDWRARAERVRFDRAKGALELSGSPRLWRGDDLLQGERITVWPREQRLVVEQARGRMQVPRLVDGRLPVP